ncbi:MAG: type I-E CRISPR-associated protein Cas6/Cse3/CasE [Acidobacteria bacterium]|nr:type I-E CRISPR-associated protein Cas6/Cse3/CasE [Acidobacteriota bacterium]
MYHSLYLAKLILNPRSRDVRRDLANCQDMHRTLLAAFPQAQSETARQEFGVLFRVEIQPRTGAVTVLVQSERQPDWSALPDDYLFVAADEAKPIAEAYQSLQAGQRLRFRLRANPTKCVARQHRPAEAQRDGKRVELRREADQLAWLQRKAQDGGFQLVALSVKPDVANAQVQEVSKVYGWRNDDNTGQRKKLTLAAAVFEGELVVSEVEQFRATLRQGIGRGKAYGFGLLSIARG